MLGGGCRGTGWERMDGGVEGRGVKWSGVKMVLIGGVTISERAFHCAGVCCSLGFAFASPCLLAFL